MDHSEETEVVESTATVEETENETPETEHSQTDTEDTGEVTKERWKQQLEGKQQQLDSTRKIAVSAQVRLAEQSIDNLLELNKTDPKMAKVVAKEFNFNSVQEAQRRVQDQSKKNSQEDGLNDGDSTKSREELKEEVRHESAIELAEELFEKLPASIREDVKAYFDDITEGKKLDNAKAKKYVDMATLYVSKDNPGQKAEGLKELASTGVSSSKASSTTRQLEINDRGQMIRKNK